MAWGVALKTAGKMLLAFIVAGLVGLILIGVGFFMISNGTADSIFEDGNAGQVALGTVIMIVGYVWIYVAGIAVLLKYFSEAVHSLVAPVLSDVHSRVTYLQQVAPQAPGTQRYSAPPPASDPNDPWSDTSPPESSG